MSDIKIKIKNKGNLLANANVEMHTSEYGMIIIKDFAIWKSAYLNERLGEHINIEPPTLFKGVRYFPKVYFEDSMCWEALESQIYDAYKDKLDKGEGVNR
ncbi:MAG: hypothetical protein WC069_00545 [Candidatus Shapirobacteria bacterium]